MKDRDPVRAAVHYRGNVQGVGFRATTVRQVGDEPVVGWVRNESDGSVRLEAEGSRVDVHAFLDRVRTAMAVGIDDERVEWVAPLRSESTFIIR